MHHVFEHIVYVRIKFGHMAFKITDPAVIGAITALHIFFEMLDIIVDVFEIFPEMLDIVTQKSHTLTSLLIEYLAALSKNPSACHNAMPPVRIDRPACHFHAGLQYFVTARLKALMLELLSIS